MEGHHPTHNMSLPWTLPSGSSHVNHFPVFTASSSVHITLTSSVNSEHLLNGCPAASPLMIVPEWWTRGVLHVDRITSLPSSSFSSTFSSCWTSTVLNKALCWGWSALEVHKSDPQSSERQCWEVGVREECEQQVETQELAKVSSCHGLFSPPHRSAGPSALHQEPKQWENHQSMESSWPHPWTSSF